MLFCIQSFEASYVSDPKTQGPTRDDLHSKRGVAHRLCDRPFDQHGRGHRASRFRSGASGKPQTGTLAPEAARGFEPYLAKPDA